LKTLKTDCMINGRTRWQGFERAWINLFENAPIGGGLAKCNPIAYWTLEDTFDYFTKYKIPYHPLHEKGYPSIGDAKDTIPIPEDGSVKFVNYQWVGDKTQWLDYARERVGRFVGLTKKDGSTKTECGIHVDGAERTWDRDLWEADSSAAIKIATSDDALQIMKRGKDAVVVVYAPWCQFSQAMEDEYEKFAAKMKGQMDVYTFRGDDVRDFVMANLNTNSFPTVNVYVFFFVVVFCLFEMLIRFCLWIIQLGRRDCPHSRHCVRSSLFWLSRFFLFACSIKADGTVVKYESEVRTVEAFEKFVKATIA
jgi:thiol-disulfide isomerase/thioredoxin